MTRTCHYSLSAVLAVVFLAQGLPVQAQTWSAGVASQIITPKEPMWMAGYGGRDRPSEGKLTELYAKALVLDDEATKCVLISLDLVGIDATLTAKICDSLKKEFGLERRQIAISVSHTHTGPVVGMNLAPLHYLVIDEEQQALVNQYAEQLHDHVVHVVGEAIKVSQPALVSWGNGRCSVAVNRRNNRPEGDVPKNRHLGTLVGPVDHDVPVLIVRKPTGEPTAIAFGYACHATVLSFYEWSGDYPGFAQQDVEKRFPGAVALFWAGCGADQNPLPRRTTELAQQYGERLGQAVAEVVNGVPHALKPKLELTYQEVPLRLGPLPSNEELQKDAGDSNKFIAARANMLLAQIAAGKPLREDYDYPIETWKIGNEITWVFLGGEVVVDFALRLKAEVTGTRTWVGGYANDVMAYIPSRRVLREGGYEGGGAMIYYGLPTVWSEDVEKQIVHEAHRQIKAHATN
jgi:neutral ceramidase